MPGERPRRPVFRAVQPAPPEPQVVWRTLQDAVKHVPYKPMGFTYTRTDGMVTDWSPGDPGPVLQIREDGRVEAVCPHGVGHPVGIARGHRWDATWMGVHGCDGCCKVVLPPGCEETRG